jgi:nucleotide-binding universal stress UspA family protein
MPAWKLLCCPIDFSRESRIAMTEAAELASRHGGELVLVHVDDRPPPASAVGSLATAEALGRTTLEIERQLGDWAEAAKHVAGKPVRFALLSGAPAEEVVRFAKDGRYDAIVMGTHGRAGRDHFVFGSVAQAVVRDAPCTVVVVRGRQAGA